MPLHHCPRCQRAQPSEARYCHFDGADLVPNAGGEDPQAQRRLPLEFVFASGRRCQSYDEFVEACMEEWDEARDLLQRGSFRQFFGNGGRLDLARAAEEAVNLSDHDLGLNYFLKRMPALVPAQGPRLDLKPRRLLLGSLRVGEKRTAQLTILNQGKGLLLGTLSVAEGGDWLRLVQSATPSQLRAAATEEVADPDSARQETVIKTAREQQFDFRIDTSRLPAPRKYHARLTLLTNGGVVEIPAQLNVTSHPFPTPPLEGVDSPRALAERMQEHPREAAPFLENGAVARWFALNGWIYPVRNFTAPGVGAVQQFFEALGLARPPAVELSEISADFTCIYPEEIQGRVWLQTPMRKWVFAQVDSDVSWLRTPCDRISGPQRAAVDFSVDSSLLEPGIHAGTLHLLANAGQRLSLCVRVEVHRPHEPFTRRLLRPFS